MTAGSAMTLLERDAYLGLVSAAVNVTSGYPEGLTPAWMRELQVCPPAGFLGVPPAEYEAVICGWFARFLGCGRITLAPSCTRAFAVALTAVAPGPGDEIVMVTTSYDSWPPLARASGARVTWAGRDQHGVPDPASVAAACTARTRAVVIVSPDNPLGTVCPAGVLAALGRLCRERGLTLIADHCLAGVSPLRARVPLLPQHAPEGLDWIALADTGKILGLAGSKAGALAYPDRMRERIGDAASVWGFQHRQYDLAVIAAILGDPRFAPYLRELSDRIGAAFLRLREEVRPPLTVTLPGAGPFALMDAAGTGLDGEALATLLRERYSVLTVPVSWFPPQEGGPETRIRAALSRPAGTAGRLAAALNACAADVLAGRAP